MRKFFHENLSISHTFYQLPSLLTYQPYSQIREHAFRIIIPHKTSIKHKLQFNYVYFIVYYLVIIE